MGHRVDQEMAYSQRGTDLEKEAARQPHTIEWKRMMGIPEPCGPHNGYQRIVAIYTKHLRCSWNQKRAQKIRSQQESIRTIELIDVVGNRRTLRR
jgi:hypothetical protein